MAPPLTLTLEAQIRICNLVSAGVPLPRATPMAGIPWSTAKQWAAKGREGIAPYAAYVEAIETAKAAFTCGLVDKIQAATNDDWKAAAWMLERRDKAFMKTEGRKVEAKVEHSGAVDLSRLTEAEADALQELVAKAGSGG